MKQQVISDYISNVNRRALSTYNQKALYSLVKNMRDGNGWVSSRNLKSSTGEVRVRELRKEKFGAFEVECVSASELGKSAKPGTFFYRIVPRSVTLTKLRDIFGQ